MSTDYCFACSNCKTKVSFKRKGNFYNLINAFIENHFYQDPKCNHYDAKFFIYDHDYDDYPKECDSYKDLTIILSDINSVVSIMENTNKASSA